MQAPPIPNHPFVPQSLLPSLCLFSNFLHLFRRLTYMNTRVFTSILHHWVQTSSPGEHQPKQTKGRLCGVAVRGEMENICIQNDSQLQVVWLIQLIIRAWLWAWSLWMPFFFFFFEPSNRHLPFTFAVNIFHQLSSHLCPLCGDRQPKQWNFYLGVFPV